MLDLEKETAYPEKKVETKGYVVSPNYKGKNPMTRTQWRRYQQNKKAGKNVMTPHLKLVETSRQKRQIPKAVGVGQGKMVVSRTMAMTVDPTGKKAIVTFQSMKCLSEVKKDLGDMGKTKEKESEYSIQLEEGKHEYSP